MFHFELTKTENGKTITTLGVQWDTRRDAAFHAMTKFKLKEGALVHLCDWPDRPLDIDGGRLVIKGRDTTPGRDKIDLGVWEIWPGRSSRVKCKYCESSWDAAGPFLAQLTRKDGRGMKCTYRDCPSNQPGFNPAQPSAPIQTQGINGHAISCQCVVCVEARIARGEQPSARPESILERAMNNRVTINTATGPISYQVAQSTSWSAAEIEEMVNPRPRPQPPTQAQIDHLASLIDDTVPEPDQESTEPL